MAYFESSRVRDAGLAVERMAPPDSSRYGVWWEDSHTAASRPRCCEAIGCVAIALAAIPEYTFLDAEEMARVVVEGMEGVFA